ncbi:MAG: hypothetical protein Q7J65_08800 [Candidatus Marinimicrobia bacterium]|nr:hypothetical protein [Candidatus Neomarinimicrobiota bacterium]
MKTKHLLLIVLTLLLVISCASTRRLLIKKDDYLGWKMTDFKMLTGSKDFSNYLKENYHLYSGYRLKMILVQEIEGPNFMKMKVEIFETKDRTDANGLYKRYQSFSQIRVGDGGSESPGLVCFYKDDYFVKISAVRNLQDKNNYLINMAQLVAAKI